ncbi:hypothetical protein EJ02DRAFT_432766 [Clathrospora elynae]|uniref:Uncharacterized protein n=1 Tax=Clathrospora elynae TaxID=706981 RepID=A0A6A5SVR5_9PLEO|nr:hypothetical protein EJ02DRAFT_432766 [Clathrospora elynae]
MSPSVCLPVDTLFTAASEDVNLIVNLAVNLKLRSGAGKAFICRSYSLSTKPASNSSPTSDLAFPDATRLSVRAGRCDADCLSPGSLNLPARHSPLSATYQTFVVNYLTSSDYVSLLPRASSAFTTHPNRTIFQYLSKHHHSTRFQTSNKESPAVNMVITMTSSMHTNDLVNRHHVNAAVSLSIFTSPQDRSRDDPPSPPPQPPPSPAGWNRPISLDSLAPLEI